MVELMEMLVAGGSLPVGGCCCLGEMLHGAPRKDSRQTGESGRVRACHPLTVSLTRFIDNQQFIDKRHRAIHRH